jgi:hypothetical protein
MWTANGFGNPSQYLKFIFCTGAVC